MKTDITLSACIKQLFAWKDIHQSVVTCCSKPNIHNINNFIALFILIKPILCCYACIDFICSYVHAVFV